MVNVEISESLYSMVQDYATENNIDVEKALNRLARIGVCVELTSKIITGRE